VVLLAGALYVVAVIVYGGPAPGALPDLGP
jgi:hypothetical protein